MTPLQKRCKWYLEHADVFAAGLAGKPLQQRRKTGTVWVDLDEHAPPNLSADVGDYEYRVKPEPKYRPFTPEEACRELLGNLISKAGDCGHSFVKAVTEGGVTTMLHGDVSFSELAAVFLKDGSPCGVPIE